MTHTIYAIYRQPAKNKILFIKELERELKKSKKQKAIIIGDININIAKNNTNTNRHITKLIKSNFRMLIYDYTREELGKGRLVKSTLDHFGINFKETNINARIVRQKITDHLYF